MEKIRRCWMPWKDGILTKMMVLEEISQMLRQRKELQQQMVRLQGQQLVIQDLQEVKLGVVLSLTLTELYIKI